MLYFALTVVGGLAVLVYLVVVYRAVPGAVSERFGQWEPLPADLGTWRLDTDSELAQLATARGEQREVREWLQPDGGFFSKGGLVQQTRYRSACSGEILRSEADRKLRRKRLKQA